MVLKYKTNSREYKSTEIGEIPIGWKYNTIEEIVSEEKNSIKIGPFGSQLKKESLVNSGYKVYGQENIFTKDFKKGSRYISEEKFLELKTSEIKPQDFIITMMGTIGKTAIAPEGIEPGIMDSHLLRIRLDTKKYLNEMLIHSINSDIVQNQIKKMSVGGIMAGLSSKVVRKIELPIPPLKEQQKIAEILSAADVQIEKTEQLIEKTKELKKSLMQQLLKNGIGHTEFRNTDIGEVPLEWTVKELGEIADVKGGKRLPKGKALLEEVTSRPYIRVTDMYMGGVDEKKILYVPEEVISTIERYRIFEGEIFISVAGTLGLIGEVPNSLDGANLTENADRICNIKCNKTYLKYYLMSDFIQNVINNEKTINAQPKLALTRIKTFKIALPSSEEQQKIGDILSSIDKQIDTYKKEKEKQIELKKALMQQLLTGKLRVTV